MTESFIELNKQTIAYSTAGSGKPLICVHGNFASKRWFTEQLRQPPKGWQIIALDLPNFGNSSPLRSPISIENYAAALAGFIEVLRIDSPVVLGHSLGGAVAMMLASQEPNALSGLVLLSSAPINGLKTAPETYVTLTLLRQHREFMVQALAPTMPSRQPDFFQDIITDAINMQPNAFIENARELERYDLSQDLRHLNCPSLVIHGGLDYIIKEKHAQDISRALAKSELSILQNVGHSLQLENPAQFNNILESFYRKHFEN